MRILSVVTLVSPLGEYGGPVRVAVNQARALAALGHDVTLAGGARGFDGALPRTVEGVPAELHPAITLIPRIGFAGVGSPGLWRWLRRNVTDYDVVHVHAARDLVTLPAARIAHALGVPYVLQTHGMIDASARTLARPLDAALTRPVLRCARQVMYLTAAERDGLRSVVAHLDPTHVPNGVPVHPQEASPTSPTVLYLARLAPRKRPLTFVEAAIRIAPVHRDVRWVLVGPDEGEGPETRAAIERARATGIDIAWEGAVAPEMTANVMSQASLYVLPSIDEPYPMSVLEAMALGLPVIVTSTCGLADIVRTAGAGAVVDDTLNSLCEAIIRRLDDPAMAREEGAKAQGFVREHHGMDSIARRLIKLYET